MNELEQKKLVTKLIQAANLISKNRLSKASYFEIPEEKIIKYAEEHNISKEEMIEALQFYFEPMEILSFDQYLDGGTTKVKTNKGAFSFDKRIRSKTCGSLYAGYPKDDNSNIIEDGKEIEEQIIKALKNYKHKFYQDSIDYFIKMKQK